jgi:hypothetical protein
MIFWWSKHVGVILNVLVCDIWINVLLQTSALVEPLYIVNWNARRNSEIKNYNFTCCVIPVGKLGLSQWRKNTGWILLENRVLRKILGSKSEKVWVLRENCLQWWQTKAINVAIELFASASSSRGTETKIRSEANVNLITNELCSCRFPYKINQTHEL